MPWRLERPANSSRLHGRCCRAGASRAGCPVGHPRMARAAEGRGGPQGRGGVLGASSSHMLPLGSASQCRGRGAGGGFGADGQRGDRRAARLCGAMRCGVMRCGSAGAGPVRCGTAHTLPRARSSLSAETTDVLADCHILQELEPEAEMSWKDGGLSPPVPGGCRQLAGALFTSTISVHLTWAPRGM